MEPPVQVPTQGNTAYDRPRQYETEAGVKGDFCPNIPQPVPRRGHKPSTQEKNGRTASRAQVMKGCG